MAKNKELSRNWELFFCYQLSVVSGQQTSCMEDTRPYVSTGENECDSRTADNCPLIKEEDNLSIAKQYYDSAYPCVMNYEWIEPKETYPEISLGNVNLFQDKSFFFILL